MEGSLQQQKESFGFQDSDVDDLRRLISDTNVYLLAVTLLASTLHLLFEVHYCVDVSIPGVFVCMCPYAIRVHSTKCMLQVNCRAADSVLVCVFHMCSVCT